MSLIAKLPYYAFIGWAGFVTFAVLITQNFFELAAVVGWCLIASSILGFYLFTIEAPQVKCEWAGWILSPALAVIVFTGVEPMTQILWVVSLLTMAYAALMYACERNPTLAQRLPRFLRPFQSKAKPRDEEAEADLELVDPLTGSETA